MRTLFVCDGMPFPLHGGWQQRTYHVLKALAEVSDVTFAGCTPDGTATEAFDGIRKFCFKAHFLSNESTRWARYASGSPPPWLTRLRMAFGHCHPRTPLEHHLRESPEATRLLAGLCRDGFDAIWASHLVSAARLPSGLTARVLVDVDDLEHRKLASKMRAQRFYYGKPFDLLEYRKWRRLETQSPRGSHEVIVCSEGDKRALGGHSGIWVVPNGVDIPDVLPAGTPIPPSPYTLVFTGALSYAPNVDAVRYFVSEIFPRILASEPRARLEIVGRSPVADVLRLANGSMVRISADVPSVAPFLEGAAVVVAPVRYGGGTRIKILEALAARKPVVATTVAAEGLDLAPGADLLLEDTPARFAEACLTLFRNPGLCRTLGSHGRTTVKENYDWRAIEARVQSIVLNRHVNEMAGASAFTQGERPLAG